jgi:hypothetical protein
MRVLPWLVLALATTDAGAGRTTITVWAASPPPPAGYGGLTYGGFAPVSGAMITEQRDVDIAPDGELRIAGIAATIDPASVQLRGVTEPTLAITEQRFIPGATTPDEILARHVGEQISVVTPKGDVQGTLRSVDAQTIVVDSGGRLQVMRRDGFVQDVRLAGGLDKPTLAWRLTAKKPGKQTVELTYRADGMSWTADYLATYDDAGKTLDFAAWATIKNTTGASFDDAELTLVAGANPQPAIPGLPARPAQPPGRYPVPAHVHLGAGEAVQVELSPRRTAAKPRTVVAYEAMQDLSASFQLYPATDCTQLSSTPAGQGKSDLALELAVPSALPDGRVRLLRRISGHLELIGEDALRIAGNVVRIRVAAVGDLVGERHAVSCTVDERARTIHEKVEVKLENRGKQPVEAIAREFMWRFPVWHVDPADETVKGVRVSPQTQEYRVTVPAGGKKDLTYTVVYQW